MRAPPAGRGGAPPFVAVAMPRCLLLLLWLDCVVAVAQQQEQHSRDSRLDVSKQARAPKICNVAADYGAWGDNRTVNTPAFRAAAAACAGAGTAKQRAVVLVPPGVFLTGAFNLSSHTELRLQRGATVAAVQPHWHAVNSRRLRRSQAMAPVGTAPASTSRRALPSPRGAWQGRKLLSALSSQTTSRSLARAPPTSR
jgi:hypothetical protein